MERADNDPLFEFGQLRHLGFRYGLLTTMVLAMGQFGLLFILPMLLQNGEHFTALAPASGCCRRASSSRSPRRSPAA